MVEVSDGASCADALKEGLSGKRFKAAIACKAGDTLLDLTAPVPTTTETLTLTPVTADTPEGLGLIRHSAAHVMAAAVKKLFPAAKVTIGPSIENGFYYDFDVETPFSPDQFEAIEAEMQRIIDAAVPFERMDISKADAVKLFSDMGEPYKVELIEGLEDGTITLYRNGDFVDLCRGPHIPNAGFVKAFKLLSVAGAYWRGDEKNRMLSRIYATAFADAKDLKEYLNRIEEAKRRDHRKLGKELGLFMMTEEGPGFPFFLPKGMVLKNTLVWTVAVVGISTLLGFILAILLNNEFKGRKLARAVVVFPWATTLIVQASIWKFIIDTDYGTLNTLLMKLGIIDHAVNWTPTAGAYFAWEIACGIFVTIPFVTFTVLSGLQSIDASSYEAVDGASYWQKMFQITIPLVRPNLTISTILNIIYVFNSFPIIWTITKGDPANRTDTLVTYLYKLAFYNGKQGQAAAVSVIGFLILLLCASLYIL